VRRAAATPTRRLFVVLAVAASLDACGGRSPRVEQLLASGTLTIDSSRGPVSVLSDIGRPAEAVAATRWPASDDVRVFTSPAGVLWKQARDGRLPGRARISLIEACTDGRSAACARELAAFLDAVDAAAAATPATGTVLQDPVRSAPDAPPVVVVPTGQLETGSSGETGQGFERLAGHSARLMRPLAVARTETTVAQFRRFVEASGYRPEPGCQHHTPQQIWEQHKDASWSNPVFSQAEDHPVVCMAFEDAVAYTVWLSGATGQRYRLPTDAEFEFFNRSGHAGRYGAHVGTVTDLCAVANGADRSSGLAYANRCDDRFATTAPVGSFPANAFGLFDTVGNVWEMTSDCKGREYVRAAWDLLGLSPADASAVRGGSCNGRHVVRGGAFLSSPGNLELYHRDIEGFRANRQGFRVVRELSARP
jgi:formylglycine-generating enzyme required for sulfatase activity